jgi:predicted nucleotidyltransferase
MNRLIENNIAGIRALCAKHHIQSLYLFGSAAVGIFTEHSDVDFLYEMDYSGFDFDNPALYPFDPLTEFFELKTSLQQLLNRKIDLIPNQQFRNKYFSDSVAQTKQVIFQNERHQKISA